MKQPSDDRAPQLPDPDEKLTKEARNAPEGDLRPFEQLILHHQGWVAANCRYITRDPNNAEDIAQDVLVKAFFRLRSFDGTSSFTAWLKRIKITHCLKHLKEQASRSNVGIEELDVDALDQLQVPAEKRAEVIGEKRLIGTVLDSMSSTLRIPLLLSDMDGLSADEIAQLLGIGLSATKMRIKRAREDFRERYKNLPAISASPQ